MITISYYFMWSNCSFEKKFSLRMHVDACKAQELVEKKYMVQLFSMFNGCHIYSLSSLGLQTRQST